MIKRYFTLFKMACKGIHEGKKKFLLPPLTPLTPLTNENIKNLNVYR